MSAQSLAVSKTLVSPNAEIIRRALASGGRFGAIGGVLHGLAYDPQTRKMIEIEGMCIGQKVDVFAATVFGSHQLVFLDKIMNRAERFKLNKRVLAYLDDDDEEAA